MIIAMQEGCSKAQVGQVISELREFGLQARVIWPSPKAVLGVVDEMSLGRFEEVCDAVRDLPGVEEVYDFTTSWKLVSKGFRSQPTEIRLGECVVGSDEVVIMAGPCAVESRQAYLELARELTPLGVGLLRGGAFKPRTSPYSFRGLGEDGLKIMAEAREVTGLPIVTEVLVPTKVEMVARYADVLQIGTRNMQNFALLEAVGDVDKPVLLKRGMMASIKELLLSAEYILARGNWQVMLCERGIRTFETETRNTLDLSAVPLLKQYTHLPVVVDPSHAAGKRELVPALAAAAVAAGADAVMVEVHQRPEEAISDGRQSLALEGFRDMMDRVRRVGAALGRPIREAA